MLIIPVSHLEAIVLVGLILAWAVLLLGHFIAVRRIKGTLRRIPIWARIVASLLIAIGSWFWFVITIGTQADALVFWLALSCTLCFIGDAIVLNRPFTNRNTVVAFGLFSAAHLGVLIGTISVVQTLGISISPLLPLTFLLVGMIGWLIVIYPTDTHIRQRLATLTYTSLLSSTIACALALSLNDPAFSIIALGSLCWLLSDLLRALNVYGHWTIRSANDVVWLLHASGQLCVGFGLLIYTVVVAPTVLA